MRPLIPKASVRVFGALDPDGAEFKNCRLISMGRPATATLYGWVEEERMWRPIDQLTGAEITENLDGSITFVGVSQEMVEVVGMSSDDAVVRWEVSPRGCQTCH